MAWRPGRRLRPLNAIARYDVDLNKIIQHWPDMLCVVGSLVTHRIRAYDLLRMLGRVGRPTPLGQGFVEYGRIAETLHLLAMVDSLTAGPAHGCLRFGVIRWATVQRWTALSPG